MKHLAMTLAVLLALAGAEAASQSLTGTIEGRVMDEQGGVLPGVSVTLTGRQGSQTTVTDDAGQYRFVGLDPGGYEVRADLQGFAPRIERSIDLTIGKTLQVAFILTVGGVAESVDVVANSSTIDVTTTAVDNSLSQDLLQNMPINLGVFNAAINLLNYAPGINDGAALGGDEDYASALLIDGVDTRDPEGGSAWVFYNYNIVEEVQVQGIGAPAEYGGFTGAVVNTVTKSGGNLYSGLFDLHYTNDDLAGDNVKAEYLEQNPGLGESNVVTQLVDYTVQLGGPFVKDKAFWWASVQRYSFTQDPSGPRTISTEVSPRYNGKLTFQLSPTDTLIGSFQFDNYNVTGRTAIAPASVATDEQTVRQDSPEAIWNGQYRKVFGSNTFLEAKFMGYWGYYYLDPVDPSSSRTDLGTGEFTGGAGYYYYADRGRNQLNVSLSTYAEAYGKHNFKFGAEIERSKSRSRYGYSDGLYFADYYGLPYQAYAYNYDIDGRNRRTSAYAQDQWQVGRLTANLGMRLDRIRGFSPGADEIVYSPTLAFGPRLGAAVDLTGRGSSVLKGFWGRYYEGASFNPWQRGVPGRSDYVTYAVAPGDRLTEIDRIPELIYAVDPDIEHLSLDEVNVSFEHQVRRDMRITATGIYRTYGNFINGVLPTATWLPFTYTGGFPDQPITFYTLANRATSIEDRLIRNVDGFQYRAPDGSVIGTLDARRDYKALMVVFNKAFSNRWQMQASYVYSQAKGTVGNSGVTASGGSSVTGPQFLTPNQGLVFTDGYMENDRPHEFKLLGGYQIPGIDVSLNAVYRGLSGRRYTPLRVVSGGTFNFNENLQVNLEPRGSGHYPAQHQIDLRLEKLFRFEVHRFGVFVDVQNLTNDDTILTVQTRYPSRVILGHTVEYGAPTVLNAARQILFGGRWSF